MDRNYEITLEVAFPFPGKRHATRIELDESEFRCFRPLPTNREIAYPDAARGEAQQEERRQRIAQVAARLASALVEAIESQDTIQGYSRDEWKKMHAPEWQSPPGYQFDPNRKKESR